MQDLLCVLFALVVVAVAERQPRRIEAAGAIAEQVDDRVQFVGHGGTRARLGCRAGKYNGGAVLMAAHPVLREQRLPHSQSDYPDQPGWSPGRPFGRPAERTGGGM